MLPSKTQITYGCLFIIASIALLVITFCFSLVNLAKTQENADLVH